jgi:hypothetical protein
MERLAEILAGRHAVHQQRDVVAELVPVLLSSFTPMWRAIALTCGGQLVEAPSALAATMAFSNACASQDVEGFRSSHTMSTMRLPVS